MKRLSAIVLLSVFLGFLAPAEAVLIDRGTGMIYDTDLGITWLQDANYGAGSAWDDGNTAGSTSTDGKMTWDNAMGWVDQLVYHGFSDWRLPTAYNSDGSGPDAGFNATGSELGHIFYNILGGLAGSFPGSTYVDGKGNSVTFENLISTYDQYWSSTEDNDTPLTGAWCFDFRDGNQYKDNKYSSPNHAWAVRDGDTGPSASVGSPFYTTMTLGQTISFDYFWLMGEDPPPYSGQSFDVLALQGGAGWQYLGQIAAYNSSSDWLTAMISVPQEFWGLETQIRFVLSDFGPGTDPTVYLRNVSSNTAPVPEPTSMLLFGTGLVGYGLYNRLRSRKK